MQSSYYLNSGVYTLTDTYEYAKWVWIQLKFMKLLRSYYDRMLLTKKGHTSQHHAANTRILTILLLGC